MKKDDKRMEEMKHYIGIIIEHFDAKIATVIEGLNGTKESLGRRMDGLEYKMDAMRADINQTFKLIAGKTDKNEGRIDNHEERITNLEKASA